jgi:hypothetical protein|tara:strand:- start:471 stop:665 length:195 start_codon:yes stop_codon:yes gene_type:complete
MAFNEMNIEDMLCDMYDIRRMAKFTTFDQSPKDSNGTVITIKDCIDNVIEQLEEHAERNNIEVA